MAKRTKTGQKRHDEGVLNSVQYYENKGYKVEADLPKFSKPKNIGGRIPDLRATKKGEEIIVEVETKDSISKDLNQHRKFKDYANRSEKRVFRKKIV